MHKYTAVVLTAAVLILATGYAQAAPPKAITSYYTNAVVIKGTNTTVGGTGLATGTVYVCIKASEIASTTYPAATITNDVRAFNSAMQDRLKNRIAAQASTNRFTSYTLSDTANYDSATNRTITRVINEVQYFTITPTLGD